MASTVTERDRALLPITRMILDQVEADNRTITYTEFAKRAQRLSGLRVVPVYHVGRMLDFYVANLLEGDEDLAHLVVHTHGGTLGAGYEDRGQGFAGLMEAN